MSELPHLQTPCTCGAFATPAEVMETGGYDGQTHCFNDSPCFWGFGTPEQRQLFGDFVVLP